jgi:hypothetical protein
MVQGTLPSSGQVDALLSGGLVLVVYYQRQAMTRGLGGNDAQ